MNAFLLGAPAHAPGGLEAPLCEHFGRCDMFTLVSIVDGAVAEVRTVANPPHVEGGCLAPVKLLAEQGVQGFLAVGMGRKPLTGFQDSGIDVFHTPAGISVGQAVQAYLEGELKAFPKEFLCKGCQ